MTFNGGTWVHQTDTENWQRILADLFVFLWILQVAVDFQEVVWIKNLFQYFSR